MFNEIIGNMWDIPADAYCITTNGFVKKNGEAVMGAGCAKEARDRFPHIPWRLGGLIKTYGNILCMVHDYDPVIFSFPVKHNWWEHADLKLIEQSATHLMEMLDEDGCEYKKVILPRPGCGNGKLPWTDVRNVLEPILDERVWIVSK